MSEREAALVARCGPCEGTGDGPVDLCEFCEGTGRAVIAHTVYPDGRRVPIYIDQTERRADGSLWFRAAQGASDV